MVVDFLGQQDLAFFGGAVPAWTIFDRYFCAIMSSTYPNRMYMHTGQTDRLTNTLTASTLPAIWDRLAAAQAGGETRAYHAAADDGDIDFAGRGIRGSGSHE